MNEQKVTGRGTDRAWVRCGAGKERKVEAQAEAVAESVNEEHKV